MTDVLKRRSAANIFFFLSLPKPDGSIGPADWRQITWNYRGILPAPPIVPPPPPPAPYFATDAEKKRRSAASSLFFLSLPMPDGNINRSDRQQLCWVYRGVALRQTHYVAAVSNAGRFIAEVE